MNLKDLIPVMTGVIVSNEKHELHGWAGHVHGYDPKAPDMVDVKFDDDGEIVRVKQTDIRTL